MNINDREPIVNSDDRFAIADGFAALDDSALLNWRAEARAKLQRLSANSPIRAALTERYDVSTAEVNDRARRAWTQAPR